MKILTKNLQRAILNKIHLALNPKCQNIDSRSFKPLLGIVFVIVFLSSFNIYAKCLSPKNLRSFSKNQSNKNLPPQINLTSDQLKIYRAEIKKSTFEDISIKTILAIRRKIENRKNVSLINSSYHSEYMFGLQGMEMPFVSSSMDRSKIKEVYKMLSKAGVQSIGTAESTWHRLGENFNNFTELDYQVESAKEFGIRLTLTVGYPPAKYNVAPSVLSTFKPEHEGLYREYLRSLFKRYKGLFTEVSLGNEVDAPDSWWIGATPSMYVRDCKIVNQELLTIDPTVKIIVFGSTGSRNNNKSTNPYYGRQFLKNSFDEGIDTCADIYSLHYAWPLNQVDFNQFFRDIVDRHNAQKNIYVTEDSVYGKPQDIIKMFARNQFLYGYKRTYYFPARDYYEGGKLLYAGLFDAEWNPKLRLLPYALSVDSMANRYLVGIAEPAPNLEAYILRKRKSLQNKDPEYSIVIWKNLTKFNGEYSIQIPEGLNEINKQTQFVRVSGIQNVVSAYNWTLDPIKYNAKNPSFNIDQNPIVIFTDKAPNWPVQSPDKWLSKHRTLPNK
jgi:hypothetical protein